MRFGLKSFQFKRIFPNCILILPDPTSLPPRFHLFASPDSEVPKRTQRGTKEDASRSNADPVRLSGRKRRISGEKMQFVPPVPENRHNSIRNTITFSNKWVCGRYIFGLSITDREFSTQGFREEWTRNPLPVSDWYSKQYLITV